MVSTDYAAICFTDDLAAGGCPPLVSARLGYAAIVQKPIRSYTG